MFVLLAFFPLLLWAEGEGSNKVTTYEVSGTSLSRIQDYCISNAVTT